MKIRSTLLIFFITISISVSAQENKYESSAERAKSVYIELCGNGIEFSANYDFRFAKKQDGFGARAGIGLL